MTKWLSNIRNACPHVQSQRNDRAMLVFGACFYGGLGLGALLGVLSLLIYGGQSHNHALLNVSLALVLFGFITFLCGETASLALAVLFEREHVCAACVPPTPKTRFDLIEEQP